jgi:hypothetical protein
MAQGTKPKIGICRKCKGRVIVSEVRGEFLYCEFFSDDQCFKCYFRYHRHQYESGLTIKRKNAA